jgi:hypothetical protein
MIRTAASFFDKLIGQSQGQLLLGLNQSLVVLLCNWVTVSMRRVLAFFVLSSLVMIVEQNLIKEQNNTETKNDN